MTIPMKMEYERQSRIKLLFLKIGISEKVVINFFTSWESSEFKWQVLKQEIKQPRRGDQRKWGFSRRGESWY